MNPDIPIYYSILLILLVFVILIAIAQGVNYGLSRLGFQAGKKSKIATVTSLAIFTWLIVTETLAFSGYFKDYTSNPPHVVILYILPIIFIIYLLQNKKFERLLMEIPPSWLINAQSIRVIIELIFWGLFVNNIISKRMTFLGSNYDILIGLFAPFISYYCFQRKLSKYYAIIFNVLGLLFHLTIVSVAFYSIPGEARLFYPGPANTLYGYFPFIWLPAFITPFI
ncbi:MAG: hypothetical protein K8H86_12150, partial [Ignavibacteriaceae bacterium]|nr:hypothetical protein [Ignavibacteriaceae bacterium]